MQYGSRLLRYLLWSFIWLGLAGGTAWANHIHMQEGPFGGIVLGVTVDRVTPQVLYAAVFGGGVFKSTSGGQLWTSIHQGLENARVLCLVQDLVTPSMLYLCTDAGVLKTSGTGDRWLPARQGIEARNVRAIVFDPQRPAHLFAATDAGVYRSDDGGESWIPTRQGLSDLDVRALGIDPLHSNIMYAATFAGMFRSLDGGHTWQATHAHPADVHVRALAVDPRRPATVYMGTARGGIYQSTNGGDTWSELNEGLGSRSVLSLTAVPTEPTTLYAGTVAGLYRLTAGEARWTMLGEGRILSITAIAPDPHRVNSLYVGTGGLVLKTADGGHTWTDLSQWVLNPRPIGSTPQESERSPAPATSHSSGERR